MPIDTDVWKRDVQNVILDAPVFLTFGDDDVDRKVMRSNVVESDDLQDAGVFEDRDLRVVLVTGEWTNLPAENDKVTLKDAIADDGVVFRVASFSDAVLKVSRTLTLRRPTA